MKLKTKKIDLHPLPKRQVVITMTGVMLALFLASLDQTIVGTAMPRIITDLGGFTRYTWVITAYIIASTLTLLIVGKLSDMYGRKWFLTAGIVIFIVGSILCGISQTMTQLILFRAFQGIGAGSIMGLSFIITGDLFSPSDRGKYMGFVGAVFGLSSVIGPTLGGYITDTLSWHWVFFVNIPLGIVVIPLFVLFFPYLRTDFQKHKFDYPGIITLILAVISTMLGLSLAGVDYNWLSPPILGMFSFSLVMLILFVIIESRSEEPIIPLSIFKDQIVSVSSIVIFFTGFAMFSGIIFIPLYFQGVLGSSATASGNFLTPMMLGMVIASIISGQLLSRAGGHYRFQGAVGFVIMALGMFLLSRMTVDTSYVRAITNIVLVGFGLGITMPLYTISVQNAVPYAFLGIATSTVNFFRQIGGAFGLAILGSIMNNRFYTEFVAALPPQIKGVIPSEQLTSLASNPQALVSTEAQGHLKSLFAAFGTQGTELFEQGLSALRQALNSALAEVFLLGLVVTILAFIINIFLKEIPLRKQIDDLPPKTSPAFTDKEQGLR
ncbi:MDR family MFS transporter [Chloroflexota bacterium]